jgi:hypothetical protein
LPGCYATTVQIDEVLVASGVTKLRTVAVSIALILQTDGVEDVKVTARPEVDIAVRGVAAPP